MRGNEAMTQDAIVEKITNMGQVVAILHIVRSFFSQNEIFRSKIISLNSWMIFI